MTHQPRDRSSHTGRTGQSGHTGHTEHTSYTGYTGYSTHLTSARLPSSRRSALWRTLRRRWRRLVRRVRGLLARVGAVVTGIGWGAIVGAALFGVVGYAAGWPEFAALGVALALLVAVCLLFLVEQAGYDVDLYVQETRTVVGSPVTAGVRIADRGRRPLWASRVEVRFGEGTFELRLPPRRTSESAGSEFPVPAERRGVVVVGPVRTVQGDPVGLFRRYEEWTDTLTVHVHPNTVTLPSTSTGFIRDLEGNPTRDLTASDISFHALRDFRPGDERRHIHWKSTARTGQLTVRQFEETRRSHIVVGLGLATTDYADAEEFELAVSAAASIALRAIRDGRELTVVTSPPAIPLGDPPPRSPRIMNTTGRARLLDETSELVWGDAEVGLGGLAHLAANAVAGISLVFLVCGSTPSVRDLRSWSLRFPPGVEIVAVVCRPRQLPSLRRISELSVLSIGYLDDLRIALSKAAAT